MKAAPALLLAASLCFCAMLPSAQGEAPPAEKQKIETLLARVEGLTGAKFIRNGSDYDAKTAARFLRGKWGRIDDAINTAADFIAKAATASGTSGKPYLIRFPDGKEIACRDYLKAELAKLEAPAATPPPGAGR